MRKTSLLLAALLAVAGIYVMLWPVLTGHRLQADTDATVQSFLEERKPEQQYPELLAALQEYNRAAVLGNTSAPIGGDNTKCVIAGHRGWRGADYFRHIDKLAVGDTVRLTNLWETLTYTVADIQIIQPHQIERIKIQSNRDLLTLLTCHPYASGGRQRYVVYCEKLPTMSQSR